MGKHHPWASRIIIIVSFMVLGVLGFSTGLLLNDGGIYLPFAAILFFVFLYTTGFIAYPFKNKNGKYYKNASHYVRQKTCDILLAGSTYLMIVYCGNHQEILFRSLPFNRATASTTILPGDSTLKTYRSIAAFKNSMKDANGKLKTWKERKKLLKEQVSAIKKAKDLSPGAKTALIILSVLVALGLIALIAALSCSLSCDGSEAAAVVVGVGGTALVIFLLIVVIRRILGKKRNKNKPAEGTASLQ